MEYLALIDFLAFNDHLLFNDDSEVHHPMSAISIDMSDVYCHVPMNLSARKDLRSMVINQVYQFQYLPFWANLQSS